MKTFLHLLFILISISAYSKNTSKNTVNTPNKLTLEITHLNNEVDSLKEKILMLEQNRKQLIELYHESQLNSKSLDTIFNQIKENTAPSELDIWGTKATITGSALSFIAIILTLLFGILTFRLTIRYGESQQEVKDLHKVIQGIEDQKKQSILNTKPSLKDTEITLSPTETQNKFTIGIRIKNFGLRPAYKMGIQWIFFKLNQNNEIESDGKQSTTIDNQYQSILNPNEDWFYKVTGNLAGGLNDLNTVITRLEITHFDDQLNIEESTFYYYRFKVNKEVEIATLEITQRDKIETYMNEKCT